MSPAHRCDAGHGWTDPGPCPLCQLAAATLPHDESLPDRPPTPTAPPPTVAGYEIVRELGSGGMGVVYQARQLSLNRDVALKVLRCGDLIPAAERKRFVREAQVVAALRHPNIVQVYEVGEANGQPYYTMELIAGAPLAGVGSLREAASLMAVVARAVDHAHRHGIVHRDLKPGNVLIAEGGTPKLVDFGVAKRLAANSGLTEPGKLVGTPHYMAPEQAAGKPDVGPAADVYALGVLLYRLLAGRVPFDGETLYAVLHKIVTEEPVSPAWFRADIPRDLEAVCLKCLQKDPAKRYESAAALADDLDRYLTHKPVSAGWTPPWVKGWKWVRRHPLPVLAVTAVLAVLTTVGVMVTQGVMREREQEQRHLAELRDERRQKAVGEAITAAMSGDVDGAATGIQKAEADGATEGDLAMLRGITDYQQGRFRAALAHLDTSIRLDPESVAARSLRTLCHAELLDWARVDEGMADLRPRVPVSPHDYLFKGYLFALRWEPQVGLPLLDEAARRKQMLAYACLARTRAVNAFELGDRIDWRMMEQAVKDLEVANRLISNCPFLGLVNLEVRMYAGFAHEEAAAALAPNADKVKAERAKAEEEWAEARKAADSAGWGHRATNHRRVLAEKEHGPEAGLQSAERDWQRYRDQYSATPNAYVSALYQLGRADEALALVQKYPPDDLNGERARGYLLAEHPQHGPAEAAAVYDALEKENRDSPVALIYIQDILLVAGYADRVAENARRFRRDDPFKGLNWSGDQRRTLAFLAGELSAAEFVANASGRRNKCTAHYLVGLRALATGDRAAARKAFEQAVATHSFLRYGYRWSGNFLTRLDADPKWPGWVK